MDFDFIYMKRSAIKLWIALRAHILHPKPWMGFSKIKPGWDFPKAWVEFSTTPGGVVCLPPVVEGFIKSFLAVQYSQFHSALPVVSAVYCSMKICREL